MQAAEAVTDSRRSARLIELAQSFNESGPSRPVSVRDVDNLRLALDKIAGDDPGVAHEVGQVSKRITDLARAKVPLYGQILDNFAEQKQLFEATKLGSKAASADPAALTQEADVALNAKTRPAFNAAARESVARQFEAGPNQAARAARELSGSVEGGKRASLALGSDAPKVTKSLRAEAQGLMNYAEAVASRSSEKVPNQVGADISVGAAGLGGGARGGFLSIATLLRKVKMSPREAEEIVDLAFKPGGAEEAIAKLEARGLARKHAILIVSTIPTAAATA